MTTAFHQATLEKLKTRAYADVDGRESNLFEVLDRAVATIAPNEVRKSEYEYINPKARNLADVVKVYTEARSAMATGSGFREAFAKIFHLFDENSRVGAFYRDAIVVAFEELDLPPVGKRHGLKEVDEGAKPIR